MVHMLIGIQGSGKSTFALELSKKFSSEYLDENWVNKDVISLVLIPLVITLILTLGCSITLFLLSKSGKKNKKISLILGLVVAGAFVITLVLDAVYFSRHILGDGYYTEEGSNFNSTLLYLLAVLLIALLIALAFTFGRKNKKKEQDRSMPRCSLFTFYLFRRPL